MKTKIFRFLWLILILLAPSLAWAGPSLPGALKVMPPHERLRERMRQGEVKAPDFAAINRQRAQAAALQAPVTGAAKAPLIGNLKALAVLVDFSDKIKTVTATFFDTLLFRSPGSGPSVRDYYNQVSYGQVDINTANNPSTLGTLGWVRAPQTYSYYVNNGYGTDSPYPHNCQKLAEDIVDALHTAGVNFAPYANGSGQMGPIMLIHAGAGAEFTGSNDDIWSHSWSLHTSRTYDGVTISGYVTMPEYWQTKSASTSDMTIGVFCHEMGHGFWDLPDLYDTTQTAYGYVSEGIGSWSLMASGSWNGPPIGGYAGGGSPAWPDAYCRIKMGFTTPTAITDIQTNKSLPQTYNNPATPTVFKLSSPFNAKEYWLLENREKAAGSYDQYLPGSGLLIWHVDENMDTNDHVCTGQTNCSCGSSHYLVALEQADGLMELEHNLSSGDAEDPFPGTLNNRAWAMGTTPSSGSYYSCGNTGLSITNISDSGSTMTADISVVAAQAPTISMSPAALTPSCLQGQNALGQFIQVWNSGGQPLTYTVTGDAAWIYVSHGSGTSTGAPNSHLVTFTTSGLAIGTYQSTISITSPSASNSPQTIPVTLTVNPVPPLARFTAAPVSGYAPLPVHFTNTSTGTIDTCTWDFGDGNGSTDPSPSHTYGTPGTYTARLTTTGPAGSSIKTATITARKPPAPVARCTARPASGIYPLTVQFTDLSTGNISSRVWDFGDGTGSVDQAPSHTYDNPGTYHAKLTVTGLGGTSTRPITITVRIPPRPVVRLTAVPTRGIYPLQVQFTDTSTGRIDSRAWDFGDGSGSVDQAPSHTYDNPGTYRARLTVTGPGGSSTRIVSIIVRIPPAPRVNFTAAPTTGPAALPVQFTDTSTGRIDSRAWDFGDGGTSTDPSPSHTYNNPGTYKAKLTVTGPGGSTSKIVYIRVTP